MDAYLSQELDFILSRLGKRKKSKLKEVEHKPLPSISELIEQLNGNSQFPNEDIKRIYRILYENGLLPSYLDFIKEDIEKNLDNWGL